MRSYFEADNFSLTGDKCEHTVSYNFFSLSESRNYDSTVGYNDKLTAIDYNDVYDTVSYCKSCTVKEINKQWDRE